MNIRKLFVWGAIIVAGLLMFGIVVTIIDDGSTTPAKPSETPVLSATFLPLPSNTPTPAPTLTPNATLTPRPAGQPGLRPNPGAMPTVATSPDIPSLSTAVP